MCDRHYINKWLVHYPRCEAVNLPRILFVTEGHFNNFLLCSNIRNLHAWPYSLLAMAMSCVLHMFLALVFILVCEMFLWKGRTYGYCVSNALSGRGREILHPDSNPEVHSSMSCLVFFFFSYRYTSCDVSPKAVTRLACNRGCVHMCQRSCEIRLSCRTLTFQQVFLYLMEKFKGFVLGKRFICLIQS